MHNQPLPLKCSRRLWTDVPSMRRNAYLSLRRSAMVLAQVDVCSLYEADWHKSSCPLRVVAKLSAFFCCNFISHNQSAGRVIS